MYQGFSLMMDIRLHVFLQNLMIKLNFLISGLN